MLLNIFILGRPATFVGGFFLNQRASFATINLEKLRKPDKRRIIGDGDPGFSECQVDVFGGAFFPRLLTNGRIVNTREGKYYLGKKLSCMRKEKCITEFIYGFF